MNKTSFLDNMIYEDPSGIEVFPQGKLFRISYDAKTNLFKLKCYNKKDLDEFIEIFSDVNPAWFYMRQYGYNVPQKLSIINTFGFFPPGFIFEILKVIKRQYGSLSVIALSNNIRQYISEKLRPIKKILEELSKDVFEVSNISEDSGRNKELISQGKKPFEYRDYQKISIEKLLFKGYGRGIVDLPTACHGKDHPILKYDGTIVKVQDVKVGDLLMGPDSKPRKVLKIHSGIDNLYKIKTKDKFEMVVNENHVLSLVRTKEKIKYPNQANKIENVSVKEYLTKAKWWKHIRKMYHVGVDFKSNNRFEIPPYELGLILGDGSLSTNSIGFTSADKELLEIFNQYCNSLNCHTRISNNGSLADTLYCVSNSRKQYSNLLREKIKQLGLYGHNSSNKFIPHKYKTGSYSDRLEILAGLIDTDGSVGKDKNGIDYISKSKALSDDVSFIARSLGLRVYQSIKICSCQTGFTGKYYRVQIGGNISIIPLRCKRKIQRLKHVDIRKNSLRTGFSIEPIGRGQFYGFELDSDHLYLDGNFFVHHNSGKSFFLGNFIYNIQKNISSDYTFLLLVPNKQLVSQMYNDFLDYGFKECELTKFTAGLKKNERFDPTKKIIIANRQYVFKNKDLIPKINVLICDEIHQVLSIATQNFINNVDCGIKIGCSGSIPRNKYQKWQLIGMFGEIVHKEEITDLQSKGFISKLKLYQINITDTVVENDRNYLFNLNPLRRYSPDENGYSEIPFNAAHDAEHEYYEKHYKDLYTPALEYISKFDENTLILFDRIEFGKRLTEMSHDIFKNKNIFYIDGSVSVKDRLEIVSKMESSGDNVLFAEFATFSTGINCKRLTNLVFVSSSKSFPRILQSIGRTLRLHESKSEARIWDINFNFKYSRRHLDERLKIYKSAYNKRPDSVVNIKI